MAFFRGLTKNIVEEGQKSLIISLTMPVNYKEISDNNLNRYGTEIDRIGPMLLANRYSDRTHFIYELLQNAEDAIRWRNRSSKLPKKVNIRLFQDHLEFSHFGLMFQEKHVRGICGIGEGTKADELTSIGKFGIGFKSVYAYTDRPEIYSGEENFAIESYVRPYKLEPLQTEEGQTLIYLPFKFATAFDEISLRLKQLGHRTLLFLREIEEVQWTIDQFASGTYLRETEIIHGNLRKVTILGQNDDSKEIRLERWIVFNEPISTKEGKFAGDIEIAYFLTEESDSHITKISPIDDSMLVVSFPTEKETHLGFLIQGPYRTTPSRDNVPKDDEWNKFLVGETSKLIQNSLSQLRDLDLLNVDVLNAMPLEKSKFCSNDSMFASIYEGVKKCLKEEELLPRYCGGFVRGQNAVISRTAGLRELLNPNQLALLHANQGGLYWLNEDITLNKTPLLRRYLIEDLGLSEIEPKELVAKINKQFMEAQSDEWVTKLYIFLLGQPGLWKDESLKKKPIIRLENGEHVEPLDKNGKPRAFLPADSDTGFQTVKKSICANEQATKFLLNIGYTRPDPVDDVIKHILPKYRTVLDPTAPIKDYSSDIRRILQAFETDSTSRKEILIGELRNTPFLWARNAETGLTRLHKPDNVYLPTNKLKTVFKDNPHIWFLDDQEKSLKGEAVRKMFEACGAMDYLGRRQIEKSNLTKEEKETIRKTEGNIYAFSEQIIDYDSPAIGYFLEQATNLIHEEAHLRTIELWKLLIDTLRDRREAHFQGHYNWNSHYNRVFTVNIDAQFVRRLQKTAWVPDKLGKLQRPCEICFSDADLEITALPSLYLQELLHFRPEAIKELAEKEGIDLEVLNLIKRLGLTTFEKLKERLGIRDDLIESKDSISQTEEKEEMLGQTSGLTTEPSGSTKEVSANGISNNSSTARERTSGDTNKPAGEGITPPKTTFHTYVDVSFRERSPQDEDMSDDMKNALAETAVEKIIKEEGHKYKLLKEMPKNHPGYDLEAYNSTGSIVRFIEVKSSRLSFKERPITLSAEQFRSAQKYGDKYWLYIVEKADNPEKAQIIRIQDPANKVRYFTFDSGWEQIAKINMDNEDQ